MKKILYTLCLAASVNGFAEITLTTEMDHENCNFTVLVNEDESVLYSETMHVDGQYMMTACWDSRVTACHVQLKDESYISGMKKNGTATFRNKENQICYFENLGLRTGNMGGFYSQPWSYIYNIDAKVSCEESSSIPLYCAKSEKMARQVLLASQELACKEKDGAFEGDVYAFERDDGSTEYCVSASCDVCDTRWRDEYMNRWKENECCKNRNKEPNLNNGTCVAPPAPGPGKIGVNYSKITAMPGCSEEDAGEGENFCEVPKSSSSSGSSSSQSSSSFSSSSVSSSSSLNSSSSGLSSSSSEKQEPAKCFPSNDEADVALLDARVTCESNGGVPNYSLDEYNCLVGACASPSSSSKAKSSSSEKVSSSSETSSSSDASSSSKTSSSSANSSSSEIRSSSSSETKVSSSSKIQSSSSEIGNLGYGICQDFPLAKVPSNPMSACFNYNGTCYKCNSSKYGSACSSDWLWIYSFQSHLVGDWYEKVSCETGEKEVEKGIGVCAAYPGSTPANVSACYSYNGSCYVCDNSKDYIDCNADWLWNYNFPTHDWFKQVDCNDPYEEEDGECVDDGLFKIQEPSDNENFKIENSYSVNFTSPIKYYDLLGRNLNKSKFSKNRMLVGVRDNRINAANQKEHIVFYIPARHLIAQTVEKCGVLYGDYGIKNGNGHDLGVYCGYPYYEYTKDSVRVDLSKDMFGRKCDNGKGRYEAVVRVSFNPILQNDYYKVVGSTFKYDGVIVRSSLRDSIARHEFGHKYYANHCWLDTAKVQEVMVVIDSICEPEVVCEGRNQSLKSLKKIAQDSVTNRLDKLAISYANNPKNDLRKLCGWYHGKYSTSNGPSDTTNTSSLVCPDLNDPSIKYEYSGCQ